MLGGADRPDVGDPGVDPDPDRDPRRLAVVAGRAQESDPRVDGPPRVIGARQGRHEEADDLVTDELVDDGLVHHEDLGGDGVEAIEQRAECRGGHRLGQPSRAADVGEEQAALHLRALSMGVQVPETAAAVPRVARPAALPDESQHRAGGWAERTVADLAARRTRQHPPEPLEAPRPLVRHEPAASVVLRPARDRARLAGSSRWTGRCLAHSRSSDGVSDQYVPG